jgi:hypothetical protein
MPDNLLRNPGFEDGADPFDPNGIVYVPKGWTFAFREGSGDMLPRQTLAWGRPNAGCLSPAQFPPHEHALFFQEGSQVLWKVWSGKSWPFYITLSQPVALTPGAHYRFTLHAHPDMVEQYRPDGKTFSADPDIGAVRAFASGGGKTMATEFVRVGALPNGRYTPMTLEFEAPAAQAEVGLEAYGLFSIENCCYFFDNFALALAEAPRPQFTAPTGNVLINGTFAEGRAYFVDDARTVAAPAGWLVEVRAGRPATALIDRRQASAADQSRLFAVGEHAWRAGAPASAPVDLRLWQALSGLAVGRTYKASALVYPDFDAGPEAVEAALTVQIGDRAAGTGWRDGRALPVRQHGRLEAVFTAAASSAQISLELRTRAAAAGVWIVGWVAVEEA